MKKNKKRNPNRAERRRMLQARPVEAGVDISNVVALFGRPLYKDFVEEDENCDRVHDCVCLLWNFALIKKEFPARDQYKMESLLITALGIPPFSLEPSDALTTIDFMCERGNAIFPEYRRIIIDHWVDDHDANKIVYVSIGQELSEIGSFLPSQAEEAELPDVSKLVS